MQKRVDAEIDLEEEKHWTSHSHGGDVIRHLGQPHA